MTSKEIVCSFDNVNRKDFQERDIKSALKDRYPKDLAKVDSEWLAFYFSENPVKEETNIYYRPPKFFINYVTSEVITYWQKRALESTHPVLKARYSGLIWESQHHIKNIPPSFEICVNHIEALIKIANENYCEKINTYRKLKRAILLSTSLNNKNLINECKKALIDYEKKNAEDDKAGWWGYCFDLLIDNKRVILSTEEEEGIITDLENRLNRILAIKPTTVFKHITPRLAKYYAKKGRTDDVKRVLLISFERLKKGLERHTAMQMMFQLKEMYNLFKKYNLHNEANEILVEIRQLEPKADSELISIPFNIKIPHKEINEFVELITNEGIQKTLEHIAVNFIPQKERIKENVYERKANTHFLSMLSTSIMYKGRTIAMIGTVEDDLEGNISQEMAMELTIGHYILRNVFYKVSEKFELNTSEVITFIKNSPIFSENANALCVIKTGLDAYFSNNFLSSIHLLIPQIENAIRNFLDLNGVNVLRPSKGGGYDLKTFGELLKEDFLKKSLGEDCTKYLSVLFTDSKGWNLRNNVCHGLLGYNNFNPTHADRVLHALLVLGLKLNISNSNKN